MHLLDPLHGFDAVDAVLGSTSGAQDRRRYGQLAGAFYLVAAAYGVAVLSSVQGRHSSLPVSMVVVTAALAAVWMVTPWRRLGPAATLAPAVVGIVLTCGLLAAATGELEIYLPVVSLIFGYAALTQPPGCSARLAVLAGAALACAFVLGSQDDYRVELVCAVLTYAGLAELVAALVARLRADQRARVSLYSALVRLVATNSPQTAASVVADLSRELLTVDGALVMLSESPGSQVYVWAAGSGAGEGATETRIDVGAEQSGLGIAVVTGEPVFIGDAPCSPLLAQRFVRRFRAGTVLYLPVPGEGGTMGVLVLWWTRVGHRLDHRHDSTLALINTQVGEVIERHRALDRAAVAAASDPLTGLGNRRAFTAGLARLAENGGVLMLDLDHFKPVNDEHGHAVGDQVLIEFGDTLAHWVRGDIVCRVGGDEFAVLVPDGGLAAATRILARLARAWGAPYDVTFSHGFALHVGGTSATTTVARADQALYSAKAARVLIRPRR